MVTPVGKREAVAHACKEHGVSHPLPGRRLHRREGRGGAILPIDRSSVRYKNTGGDDADLREAIKAEAAKRRRFGYRRIAVMLARQGIHMNLKKLRRLYREEKLEVRKCPSRRRSACLPVNGRPLTCSGYH
ncbi:IS3 family transposase [Cohaesibacter celericrescens]|uniref:IS3 family transposase n=1 Tax=Cohaesibacter celericrescens TaxID=2067669 RepID=UPI00356241A5